MSKKLYEAIRGLLITAGEEGDQKAQAKTTVNYPKVKVKELFFAERVTKYKWIDKNEDYIVKSGGKVSDVETRYTNKFAKEVKNETIKDVKGSVSDGVNSTALKAGDVVKVVWKEKAEDGYEYKKVRKTRLKRKIYVVANCNAKNGKLNIEIHEYLQSSDSKIYDGAVKFLEGEEEKSKITFDLKETKDNLYVKEIILSPKKQEDFRKLVKKFITRTNNNAFLFFKAEVTDSKDDVQFPDATKSFLNKAGERLEIISIPWVDIGKSYIGLTEGANPVIQEMIDKLNTDFGYANKTEKPINNDAGPWCGVFVYHCLIEAGLSVTSNSWQTPALNTFYSRNWKECSLISEPKIGAIAVMNYGHVGMIDDFDNNHIWLLGGNQPKNGAAVRDGVEVNITKYKRSLVSKYVIPKDYKSPF